MPADPIVEIAAREITCSFQIGHHEVQCLAIEHPERLAAITDGVYCSKAFRQDFSLQLQDRFFFVNQQNAALPFLWLFRDGGRLFVAPNWREWQEYGETGTARRDVANQNFAAVFGHDAVANAQTQSSSLTNRLGRVKGIEHFWKFADTGSAVGEGNEKAISFNVCSHPQLAAGWSFCNRVERII